MSDEKLEKSEAAKREERVLTWWQDQHIFEKSLKKPSPKGDFIFHEGPPTANGKPGIHHLEARSFKDAIPRYKTMRGYHVPRRAGWDTHGLPVELEVEKQLGFSGKQDIEKYGVAAFNKKCRESVLAYINIWDKFTNRIGYWVDQGKAYFTFDAPFMESVWAIVKRTDDDGRLYKDYKVLPWCVSCGTALSSHELAQGYEDVKDLTITAKFELVDEPGTYLLAWTTTPWTLPGNIALAVGENIDYVKVRIQKAVDAFGNTLAQAQEDRPHPGELAPITKTEFPVELNLQWEYVIFAKARLETIQKECLKNGYSLNMDTLTELKGNELVGRQYKPLYDFLPALASESEKTKFSNAYKVYAADFVTTEDGTGIVHTAVMYGTDDFILGTSVGLPKVHMVGSDGRFIKGTGFLEGKSVIESDTNVEVLKDLQARGLYFSKENYLHSYPHCWRSKNRLIYYARDSWYIRMEDLRPELLKENAKVNWEPSYIRDGRMGEWLANAKDWAISRERYWGTPLPVWEAVDGSPNRIVIGSVSELEQHLAPGQVLPKNDAGELDLHRPYIDEVILTKNGKEYRRVKEVMDVWLDSGAMPFAQDHYPFENKNWIETKGYPADFISEAIDQTRGWFYTLLAVGVLMKRGHAYRNVICLGHLLDAEGKKMSKSKGNVIEPFAAIDRFGADTLRFWMYYVNQPGDSKNFDEKTVKEVARILSWFENSAKFYELFKAGTPSPVRKEQVIDRWMRVRTDETIRVMTEAMDAYRPYEATRALAGLFEDLSQWYVRRVRDRVREGDAFALVTLRQTLHTCSRLLAPYSPFLAEEIYQAVKFPNNPESVHLSTWPEVNRPFLEKIFKRNDGTFLEEMQQVRELASEILMRRQKENINVRQPITSASIVGSLSSELTMLLADEVNAKEIRQNAPELSLDTVITPELAEEGTVRELLRLIQDTRKKAGLEQHENAGLVIETDDELEALIERNRESIMRATKITAMMFGPVQLEPQFINDHVIELQITRA